MKVITLIVLLLTTTEIIAQDHLIGITAGASWTNTTSRDFSNKNNNRQGIKSGITYEYFLKKRFSVEADLIYSQRGFTDDLKISTDEKVTEKTNYNYLSVPLKIGFNHFKGRNKLFSFAKVGLIPALLIEAKTTLIFVANGKVTGKETFNIINRVSKFDLAGLAEIGGGYKIENRLWLTTSLIYQHSVTSITNTEYFVNTKIRHNGMTLSLGLQYALIK